MTGFEHGLGGFGLPQVLRSASAVTMGILTSDAAIPAAGLRKARSFPDNVNDATPIVLDAIVECYGLFSFPKWPCALRCPVRSGMQLLGDDGITDGSGWRRGCW